MLLSVPVRPVGLARDDGGTDPVEERSGRGELSIGREGEGNCRQAKRLTHSSEVIKEETPHPVIHLCI